MADFRWLTAIRSSERDKAKRRIQESKSNPIDGGACSLRLRLRLALNPDSSKKSKGPAPRFDPSLRVAHPPENVPSVPDFLSPISLSPISPISPPRTLIRDAAYSWAAVHLTAGPTTVIVPAATSVAILGAELRGLAAFRDALAKKLTQPPDLNSSTKLLPSACRNTLVTSPAALRLLANLTNQAGGQDGI